MVKHPGQTMTIHDIPSVVNTAYPLTGTRNNFTAGFRTTGISPFNRDIFNDLDFAPGFTINRPVTIDPDTGPPDTDNNVMVTLQTTRCTLRLVINL